MSFTFPLFPRTQLCARSSSNTFIQGEEEEEEEEEESLFRG